MSEPLYENTPDLPDIEIRVQGDHVEKLPNDLYVPDDALYVALDRFEGPLDLLLYLIRKHHLNVLDFSVAEITDQYMSYLDLMSSLNLQIAGEYLVMAATLMMIKSKALLPQTELTDEDEEDSTAALRQRLLAYQRLKDAASGLNELPRMERDTHAAHLPIVNVILEVQQPDVDVKEILLAFADLLKRAKLNQQHDIARPVISVRDRMGEILSLLDATADFVPFDQLFKLDEGKPSIIASLLALLELLRSNVVEVSQQEPFAPIFVKSSDTQSNA